MRRFDKKNNIRNANKLAEQRYLQSKELINENEVSEAITLQDKLNELVGAEINLIKTLHTTGNYNPETGEMDKVKKDTPVNGVIGEIVNEPGVNGLKVMNPQGGKIAFLMYDKRTNEFVEGDSSFKFTYKGADEKSERILQFILRYLVQTNQ